MPSQKLKNKSIRKLIRFGRASLVVSLPIELVTALKWRPGQKVVVKRAGRHLLIKDWR